MLLGTTKLKKMTKICPGMAEIQAKMCGRHISLAKVAMRIYFL
jgi:hypothetical protein